jgi:hypothetical protein
MQMRIWYILFFLIDSTSKIIVDVTRKGRGVGLVPGLIGMCKCNTFKEWFCYKSYPMIAMPARLIACVPEYKPIFRRTQGQRLLKGEIGTNERGVCHPTKTTPVSCANRHHACQPPGS